MAGIAGAFMGVDNIRSERVEIVQKANPEPDIQKLAAGITQAVKAKMNYMGAQIEAIKQLMGS